MIQETTNETSSNVNESLLARDSGEPQKGNAMGNVTEKMESLRQKVVEKMDPVRERVQSVMSTAADKLHNIETPDLSNLNLSTIRDQASETIRRYPLQSIAVGLGVGMIFGRALKR